MLTGIGILLEPAELDPPCPTIELAFLALVRLAAAAAMADAVLWYVLLPGLLDITISLAFVEVLLVIAIPVEAEELELEVVFPMSDWGPTIVGTFVVVTVVAARTAAAACLLAFDTNFFGGELLLLLLLLLEFLLLLLVSCEFSVAEEEGRVGSSLFSEVF